MSGDRLTDDELTEIDHLIRDAHTGPWESLEEALDLDDTVSDIVVQTNDGAVEVAKVAGLHDARLVAAAPEALRRLLAEVRERRADDSKRAWVDAGAPMLGESPLDRPEEVGAIAGRQPERLPERG